MASVVNFHHEAGPRVSISVPVVGQQSISSPASSSAASSSSSSSSTPFMERKVSSSCVWCLHFLLVIAVCVIVPTVFKSFHVVTYDKVAFRRDVFGSVDTSRVYTPGRYFLPLTQRFVEFDNTFIPIAFVAKPLNLPDNYINNPPLSVALSSGVQVRLQLLFQYRIDQNRLHTLYAQYSTTYLSQIISVATATAKTAVIRFDQEDYLQRSQLVVDTLADAISAALDAQLYVIAPKDKFKLLGVEFPDSVVQTSLQAAMSLQRNEVALLQQQVVAIETETQRQVAEVSAQQNQTLEQASIDAERLVSFAQNQADNVGVEARAHGQAAFTQALGIHNHTTQLVILRLLNILDATGQITFLQTSTPLTSTSALFQV